MWVFSSEQAASVASFIIFSTFCFVIFIAIIISWGSLVKYLYDSGGVILFHHQTTEVEIVIDN
jgi:hypothetical protein